MISARNARKLGLCMLATLSLAFGTSAMAQAVALSSTVSVERRIVTADGDKVEWTTAETVVPGDKLQFIIKYRNETSDIVSNFVINNPVSANVSVSDLAASQLVSVDGGKTFGRLDQLTVVGADGNQTAATPEQVTHLRWVIASIPPGGQGDVHFFAKVR